MVLYVGDNIPFSVRKDLIPERREMVSIGRPYYNSFLLNQHML